MFGGGAKHPPVGGGAKHPPVSGSAKCVLGLISQETTAAGQCSQTSSALVSSPREPSAFQAYKNEVYLLPKALDENVNYTFLTRCRAHLQHAFSRASLTHRTTQGCLRQRTTHRCRRPRIMLTCQLQRLTVDCLSQRTRTSHWSVCAKTTHRCVNCISQQVCMDQPRLSSSAWRRLFRGTKSSKLPR